MTILRNRFFTRLLALLVLLAVTGSGIGLWVWARWQRNPGRIAAAAENLFAAGQVKAALDQYQRALKYTGTSPERANLLARMAGGLYRLPPQPLQAATRYFNYALSLEEEAVKLVPGNRRLSSPLLEALYRKAQVLDSESAWEQMLILAGQVLHADQENVQAVKYWAVASLQRMRWKGENENLRNQLYPSLDKAAKGFPDDPEIRYFMARCMIVSALSESKGSDLQKRVLQLHQEALQPLRDFIVRHPDHLQAKILEAQLLLDLGQIRNSGIDLEPVRVFLRSFPPPDGRMISPEDVVRLAPLLVTIAPEETQDINGNRVAAGLLRAIAFLRQKLAQAPENREIMLLLSQYLRSAGQTTEAEQLLTATPAERLFPVQLTALKAWYLHMVAMSELANLRLDAVENQPDPEAREAVFREVESHFRELQEWIGATPWLALLQGKVAFGREHWREAVTRLDAANREFGRFDPEISEYCGLALGRCREDGAALEQLERSWQSPFIRFPRKRLIQEEMAEMAWRNRNWPRAEALTRSLLSISPEPVGIRLRLGRILLAKGVAEEQLYPGTVSPVVGEIEACLKPLLEQEDAGAIRCIGELRLVSGRFDPAAELLEPYCRRHPDDPEALIMLLQARSLAGKPEFFWTAAESWLRGLPDNRALVMLREEMSRNRLMVADLEQLLRLALQSDAAQRETGLYLLLLRRGNPAEALAALDRAAVLKPDDPDILDLRFQQLLNDHHWDQAAAILAAAAKILDAAQIEFYRARLDLARNNFTAARKRLEPVVQRYSLYSDGWVLLGDACRLEDLTAQAEDHYRRALSLRPNHTGALTGLFQILEARGQPLIALNYLRNALNQRSLDNALGEMYLDAIARFEGRNQALKLRLKQAELRPWNHANRRAAAKLCLELKTPDRARELIDALREEDPENLATLFLLADYFRVCGRPEESKKILEPRFADGMAVPPPLDDWLTYARYLHDCGYVREAEAALLRVDAQQALETMPISRQLADWYFQAGNYEEARRFYQKVMASGNPGNASYGVIESLIHLGRIAEAEPMLKKVPATPQSATLLAFIQAKIASAQGRTSEALDACGRAILAAPNQPYAYVFRAELRLTGKQETDATAIREDLETALQLQPNLVRPRELLAQFYLDRNQAKNATTHWLYLVEQYPGQAKYRIKLGWSYVQTADWSALEALIRTGRQLHPDRPDWDLFQGHLLLAQGQPAAAATLFETCYRRQPATALLSIWVEALLAAGQPAKALTLFSSSGDPATHPELFPLRNRMAAMMQHQEKNPQPLLADLQTAAAHGAEAVDAVLNRVRALLTPDELTTLLHMASAQDSTGAIRLWQAIVLLELKEFQKALPLLAEIRPLLEKNPGPAGKYYLYAGYAAHLAGRHEEANREYEKALQVLPQDPVVLNNLAALLSEQLNLPDKALPLAEKAVALAADRPEIAAVCLDTLGYARLRAKLFYQARTSLEQSIRIMDTTSARLHLAEAYLALNLPEQANQELATIRLKALDQQDQATLEKVEKLQQEVTGKTPDKK